VQMEELAQRIRRLACDLCSDKQLGEKRRFGTSISAVYPDGMVALKKTGRNPSEEHGVDGTPNFIWSPHLIGMG